MLIFLLSLLLFFIQQCLRPALADIWNMCSQISETGLFHIEPKHTYTLWDFQDTQVKQLQKVLKTEENILASCGAL